MKKYLYMVLLLIVISSAGSAQDTVRIYMLSRNIGTVIDPDERAEFNLFGNVKNKFISAYYFKKADSSFWYIIRQAGKEGVYDSLSSLSFTSFRNSAKRVQYLEKEKSGMKNLSSEEPVIYYADSVITIPAGLFSSVPAGYVNVDIIKKGKKRMLPLTGSGMNPAVLMRDDDFELYIGTGITIKPFKIKGIREAMNYIEERLPDPGYTLLKTSSDFKTGAMLNVSSILFYRRFLSAELRWNFNFADDNLLYRSFSARIGYNYMLNDYLTPYLAAGYTRSYFQAKGEGGGLTGEWGPTVDFIEINGHSQGLEVLAGLIIFPGDNYGINISAGYRFMESPEWTGYYLMNPDGTLLKPSSKTDTGGMEISLTFMVR